MADYYNVQNNGPTIQRLVILRSMGKKLSSAALLRTHSSCNSSSKEVSGLGKADSANENPCKFKLCDL